MSFITTESELLDAIRHRTVWLAECLQRISRFGGQHPTANVLNHSLDVRDRILSHNPAARPEQLVWACLHDCHEILSGDISRRWKTPKQVDQQEWIDHYLVKNLRLDLSDYELQEVGDADTTSGDLELLMWADRVYPIRLDGDVLEWCETVEGFMR